MRLWSIHPKYLDSIGLVAQWREVLLALKVLENKTKGYKNHPQLNRFKNTENPIESIKYYIKQIAIESKIRKFNFNVSKIENIIDLRNSIQITNEQINYEYSLLLSKLKKRDINKYKELLNKKNIEINAIFMQIEGPIEKWEKIKKIT